MSLRVAGGVILAAYLLLFAIVIGIITILECCDSVVVRVNALLD